MEGTNAIAGTMPAGTLLLGDRFKVLKLLGGGGMGEVYVAEQLSLGRKVALKVLRSEMGQVHGMSERFRREALLLSSVDHPSVVRIIDFGESAGAACLVMELVEGDTLDAVLREGPLAPHRATLLLRQLAEGLAAVHSRGIVHRDLKPQNVIVCEGALGEQARLLDFGIARLTENEGPGGGVTQAGIVIGTPEYLSPEQAVAGKFDERSDLYSLGILAYFMLSLKLPLPGPSAREFIIQHATRAPTPLLEAAPQLASYPALVQLVMQCLEKQPEDRPKSAAAIAQALLAVPGGGTVVPIPVSPSMFVPVPSGVQGPAPSAPQPTAAVPPPSAPPVPSLAMAAPALSATPAGASGVGFESTRLSQPGLLPAPPTVGSPHRDFVPTAPTAPTVRGPTALTVPRVALVATVVLALGALAILLGKGGAGSEARKLLDDGQAQEALTVVDQTLRKEKKASPPLLMLRGEALHDLKRHEEEWETLGKLGNSDLEGLTDGAFAGLMEDYGKGDNEEPLIALLDRSPRKAFNARAEKVARAKDGKATWGALRFWDKTGASDKGSLVAPYIAALDTEDCRIRGIAAKRLGDLGDADALAPLEALLAQPRPRVAIFLTSCGHDEAERAINQLKKKK